MIRGGRAIYRRLHSRSGVYKNGGSQEDGPADRIRYSPGVTQGARDTEAVPNRVPDDVVQSVLPHLRLHRHILAIILINDSHDGSSRDYTFAGTSRGKKLLRCERKL